jgi:hypothetical protein
MHDYVPEDHIETTLSALVAIRQPMVRSKRDQLIRSVLYLADLPSTCDSLQISESFLLIHRECQHPARSFNHQLINSRSFWRIQVLSLQRPI